MTVAEYLRVELSQTAPFATPLWVDITSRVRSIQIDRGFSGPFDLFSAGRCRIECNNGTAAGQAPVVDVGTALRWYPVRVRSVAETAGVPDWSLFTGYVAAFSADESQEPFVGRVTIDAVDLLGLLAAIELPGDTSSYFTGTPLGSGQALTVNGQPGYISDVGARELVNLVVEHIASYLGSTPFSVTASNCADVRMWVARDRTGNALQFVQDYLEAERARLECDTFGELTIQGRWHALVKAADMGTLTPARTFGAGFQGRILQGKVNSSNALDSYYDAATIKGVSNAAQTSASVPAGYPPTTYSRTNTPIVDANWCKATADMVVAIYRQTSAFARRIRTQVASARSTSVDSSHPALDRHLADALCGVYVEHPGGIVTAGVVLVDGVRHDIDPQTGWMCELTFSSADRLTSAYDLSTGLFTIDTSTIGSGAIVAP